MSLRSTYNYIRKRVAEIYYRLRHSVSIFRKRFPSIAVTGKIVLPSDFVLDEATAKPRGYQAPDGAYYSKVNQLSFEQLPRAVVESIRNYDSILRLYLGDGYLINDANIWRNYSIPVEIKNQELISNHWHYDKVVDFRNIQLFVLLGDVSEDDGPLEFLINPNEYRLMPSVLNRSNADLNINSKKLTGKRGDTFLFSTGSTPHRAGIPKDGHFRDIFSVAFFPAYTKIGKPAQLLLMDLN